MKAVFNPFAHEALSGLRILQIFNRYLQYGGEEGSVYWIGDALQEFVDVEYFFESSQTFVGESILSRMALPLRAWRNFVVARKLRRLQAVGRFGLWQIHNVFPALSPAVYLEAFEQKVPVLHYLHNYRLSCVNGFFLNHGNACTTCIDGNFWNAPRTACWHQSRLQSGVMAAILAEVRRLGILQKINRWIAISQAQKDLHVRMGIPATRIDVVPHFLEPQDPAPDFPSRGHALFLGRLSEEKGVSELIRAWGKVSPRRFRLDIIGDGPESAGLRRQVEEENVDGVRFHGFCRPEAARLHWTNASFIVVPSIWQEPFGMVVLEAWAKKRAVVAYGSGALPELISHGVDGLLVRTRDVDGLARAVQTLLENPETAREMGRRGHEKLREVYNKDKWLKKLASSYTSALSGA